MVEPGGRGPGHRPRLSHRANQEGVRTPAGYVGNDRGKDGDVEGEEALHRRRRAGSRAWRRAEAERGGYRGTVRAGGVIRRAVKAEPPFFLSWPGDSPHHPPRR